MRRAALQAELESALAGRVAAPFLYGHHKITETASIGIPELDALAGGLPRGSLTEVCGPPCSGHMSVLLAALASRTAQTEACALVDGHDAFDPRSAEAAGVKLKNLLWVRCRNVDQSFRATDLLLKNGGFGMVALDLSDTPPRTARQVPLNAWFRFRKTVEDTPTILLVLEQEPNAKTCASLVLQLGIASVHWNSPSTGAGGPHALATLLDGFEIHVEVLRSRMKPVTEISGPHGQRGMESAFAAKTIWSCAGNESAALEPK